MTLIKTGLLNAIAVAVRILSALALNKVLAVYVGPSGYAMIGQFQNAMSIVLTFASGAINTGVVKYTAEYFDDEPRQQAVWRTAGMIALMGSLVAGITIAVLHRPLAMMILGSETYGSLFLWFAVTLTLFVLNALLLALLNGKKEIPRFVAANIAGSLVGAAVTGLLASRWGLYGALLALTINQSIVLIATLALCRGLPWLRWRLLWGRPDAAVAKNLGRFALMAVTSACVVPISHILIRDHLIAEFGLQAAGYWQAVWKISEMYLMLITTTLSVYYLPRLSEIRSAQDLKKEIFQGYRVLLPLAALGALTIYLLRDWMIALLFTVQFAPMRDLFMWQLIGDVLKIGAWLLAYVMLGHAMTKTFMITEVVFSASFVGLVMLLTLMMGLQGVSFAYLINYLIYWPCMYFIVNRRMLDMKNSIVEKPE